MGDVGLATSGGPWRTRPASGRLRSALWIRPFRRLRLELGLSSLGDWLGLLAIAMFASAQVTGAAHGLAFAR
jgi:hypothetical protein